MMNLANYLDSTYLKTPKQSGLSDSETLVKIRELVQEAIDNNFYAVMIRPDYIGSLRMMLDEKQSTVKLGTVIDFPLGENSVSAKLSEARKAIVGGADELDFVIDYKAFKAGKIDKVQEEVEVCTLIALKSGKIVKWIIETAALTDAEIIAITQLIRDVGLNKLAHFPLQNIFVKSSTGFYETPENVPNGATPHVIRLMVENAGPLSVKASGGVRNREEAEAMIQLGVKRIGTSSALRIIQGEKTDSNY